MPSIASSLNELRSSVTSIFIELFHAFLAVFHAILGLGQAIISSVVNLGRAFFIAAVGILGDTVGLIWSNLFVLALFAGGYYLYQRNTQNRSGKGKRRV
ncbi:hypothetical protein K439DRAFT_1401458 [Ramaria rubella]|nr:hypothetical protein K439DRAFT_1401458 [Ramaria rubella]